MRGEFESRGMWQDRRVPKTPCSWIPPCRNVLLSRSRGMMNTPQLAAQFLGVVPFDTARLAARSFIGNACRVYSRTPRINPNDKSKPLKIIVCPELIPHEARDGSFPASPWRGRGRSELSTAPQKPRGIRPASCPAIFAGKRGPASFIVRGRPSDERTFSEVSNYFSVNWI